MKRLNYSPLTTFVVKVLLFLPMCLAVWYWLIVPLTAPLAWVCDWILSLTWGRVIDAVTLVNHQLEISTLLAPPGLSQGQLASLAFDINPLLYSYSFPFAVALILSTPSNWIKTLASILIAYIALLLVQSWGVCFHVAKTLMYQSGPEIHALLNVQPVTYVLVGLAYQFGYLILPSLSPLIVWGVLFKQFVYDIAPQLLITEQRHR
ncbi:MAG: hypothetical protein K0U68_14015 [Gammaproteobacteria bacterium]|nr:hypothetical protein [Gammaproteobacteria bacterium]